MSSAVRASCAQNYTLVRPMYAWWLWEKLTTLDDVTNLGVNLVMVPSFPCLPLHIIISRTPLFPVGCPMWMPIVPYMGQLAAICETYREQYIWSLFVPTGHWSSCWMGRHFWTLGVIVGHKHSWFTALMACSIALGTDQWSMTNGQWPLLVISNQTPFNLCLLLSPSIS